MEELIIEVMNLLGVDDHTKVTTRLKEWHDALTEYANPENWHSEAEFSYESAPVDFQGGTTEYTGHVELDTQCVWSTYGDNAWDLAKEALSKSEN